MKRTLPLIPCLALTAFGGYYHHWNTGYVAKLDAIAAHPLAMYNFRDGAADAQGDLERRRLRLLTFGPPPPEIREYQDLLRSIHRVELESLTLEPTLEVKRYAIAYNGVMWSYLNSVHGREVLGSTRDLSRRRHTLNEHIARYVPPIK